MVFLIFFFFCFIETFDIQSNIFNFYNISKYFCILDVIFFNIVYNTFLFYKIRFLFFFFLICISLIFYINLKTKKKKAIVTFFLFFFNTNLKDILFFKKINFLNWLFILFLFILFSNILGLVPETIALNSIFLVTLYLSFWISFVYNFYGLSIKKELWFNNFLPSSIPFLITAPLFFIETISYFIRIFSLAIRLFANILAGHILLHLLITYLSLIIKSLNFFLILFSFLFFFLIFSLNLLEVFMAFMQAYIFILLLSMWFNENLVNFRVLRQET